MQIADIAERLDLKFAAGADQGTREVRGGYCCDLLSNVMGHCQKEFIWITIQTHQNILGVASLLDLSAIIIAEGFEPDEDTLVRAEEKEIPILTSDLSGFDLSGRLYSLGLRGPEDE